MAVLHTILSLVAAQAVVSLPLEQCLEEGRNVLLNRTEGEGFSSCFGSIIDLHPDSVPFEITSVSSDGSSVSFKVTQGFATTPESKLGVKYFESGSEIICDVRTNQSVGWASQEYTAACDANAKAEVKAYLYLCGRRTDVCDYCETPFGSLNDYLELTYELQCKELCPTSVPTLDPSSKPSVLLTSRPTSSPTIFPNNTPRTSSKNPTTTNPPSGSQGDPHCKFHE